MYPNLMTSCNAILPPLDIPWTGNCYTNLIHETHAVTISIYSGVIIKVQFSKQQFHGPEILNIEHSTDY